MVEREKKYLVRELPNLDGLIGVAIKQGYFSIEKQGPAVASPLRIRQEDEDYSLVKKFTIEPGNFGLSREATISLSAHEFESLWPAARFRLAKTRYRLPLQAGLVAELDIFSDQLFGFVQVEVEFASAQEEHEFVPPDWFGADITVFKWAHNAFYVTVSYDELKKLMEADGLAIPWILDTNCQLLYTQN